MEQLEVILFWLALIVAGVTFLLYLRIFFVRAESKLFNNFALLGSWLTLLLITIVLSIQWLRTGLHPFTGPFSAKVFYAFSILVVYMVFETLYVKHVPKMRMVGVMVFPAIVVLLLLAWTQFEASPTLAPNLKNFRVFAHVSSAIFAYGSFTLGTIFSIIYLIQEKQLKSKKAMGVSTQKLPSLETAEISTHRALGIGFLFSIILLLTGMFTAQMVWGRMWDWSEPRETSAFIMVLLYAFYFFSRDVLNWRGKKSSYVAILAFLMAIFTYVTPYIFSSISRHKWGGF